MGETFAGGDANDVIDTSSTAYTAGTYSGYAYVAVDTVVAGAGVVSGVRAVRAAGGVAAFIAAGRAAQATRVAAGRAAYVAEVSALAPRGKTLLDAGESEESVARTLFAERNAIKAKYIARTPPMLQAKIYVRNILKYQNPVGPTISRFIAAEKSWADIIASSSRTGGRDLGF